MHGTVTDHDGDLVAIIGMAARLPGAADVDAFWRNQLEGLCAITRQDAAALRAAGFSDADLADPRLAPAFGVLDGVADFDARFFGYPPARAQSLDPQQRLLLEVAWHALEHAGYGPGTIEGSIGAYLSIAQSGYPAPAATDVADAFFELTSRDKDYAASRVAYKLDLTGPSLMIQSASSGSLAAVHAAAEALIGGQCDMAIAGGCSIALPQGAYRHAPGLMLSATGVCRAFDAAADGAVPGSGLGVVVLKLLRDALADGDAIYAVIRGSALNNDGANKSDYLAPGVAGQARVIGEALAAAGVAAETIGYVETHGTATPIGDPIEIRALARAFEGVATPCALGALKPSIGHLHVASGVAGLIRAALAVHHGVLPPTLGFSAPNPELSLETTPFYINTSLSPWPKPGPRRAGVSAFGLGGTNVHVVLEQAPARPRERLRQAPRLPLLLSAKTPRALEAMARDLAAHLRAAPAIDLVDVAFTLAMGRQRFAHRLAIACASREEAIEALSSAREVVGEGPMLDAASLWLTGERVDWAPLFRDLDARRIPLPLYPFERARHWIETPARPTTPRPHDTLEEARDLFARVLKLPPEDLDPDANYESFGVDSLLVGSITQKLRERYPSLRSTVLFEHNSLRRLAAHLEGVERSDAEDGANAHILAPSTSWPGLSRPSTPTRRGVSQGWRDIDVPASSPEPCRDVARRELNADDGRRFPPVSQRLGVDGRDEPGHDGGRVSLCVNPTAAREGDGGGGAACEPIAIIGMAGRYPGARDLAAFWDNLQNGRDSISEAPADRWDIRDSVDPQRKDKSYTRWGGFLTDVDAFDALFFGVSPREARLIDPQQRLFLECAWAALEDAGYTRRGLEESAGGVGVFAGAMHAPYRLVGFDAVAAGVPVQSNHWSIANRVSYAFDFSGPSFAIDSACSSSLTAIHLACESLRRGECGAALAGGVNLVLHPQQPLELCRAGMLSHGPATRAFGDGGDGFVQGEGVGIVLLKPLAAALADGDSIRAVILGSAINAGGKTSGYTVPNPRAQSQVVTRALRSAGAPPASISYVECHGTGTSLGDPIEIAGLADALSEGRAAPCALGSVKSNIGHLEAAAGIAGLTKAVLQLQHGRIVPSLHASPPNPKIDFSLGPFRVAQQLEDWDGDGPRRAGVSSFGAGGANAHIVLEAAPEPAPTTASSGPWLVPLSARDPERLALMARSLRERLASGVDLADVAYTLGVGREAMEARFAVVVADRAELLRALERPLALAQAGAADATALARALERRDLHALAELWMQGATIDFARLYDGETRRRVSLPGHPLLRERHWLPEAPRRLLGEATPTLSAEARWPLTIVATDKILAEHRVDGVPTLPGVASILCATEAMERLGRAPLFGLRGLTWLRPLAVEDGSFAAECRLSPAAEGLRFDLLRGEVVHATGAIIEQPPTRDREPSGSHFPASPDAPSHPGEALYERLAARGLVYGEAFRRIESYAVSGAQATAVAQAGEGAAAAGFLDCVLQLTAALIEEEGPLLPFAVEEALILRRPSGRCRIAVRRAEGESSPGLVRFDAVVEDESGALCLVFRDLAGRLLATRPAAPQPRGVMSRLFGNRAAAVREPIALPEPPPFFEPSWREAPASLTPGARAKAPLLLGAEEQPLMRAAVATLPKTDCDEDAEGVLFLCEENEAALDRLFALVGERARRGSGAPFDLTLLGHCADGRPSPWIAAAMGLARVAAHEFPAWRVRCHLVETPADVAAALADPGDSLGREILWRDGRRFVRALHPVAPAAPRPAFRPGGVTFILGGIGGIGLALAAHVATRHGGRVALFGRTPPGADVQRRLEALGGIVEFFAADACDPVSMRRAIAAAKARLGAPTGAIHAAMVMRDQSLTQMTAETFHAALDVKTRGAENFVAALAGDALDWLSFFSSANSFAANAGQANYVAGCAFVDAFAKVAAARLGCPAPVINWGFWGEVGRVADPAYHARLARQGVQPIATAEGLAAIERALGGASAQLLVLKAEEKVLRSLGVETSAVDAALEEHAALDALTRDFVAAFAARNADALRETQPRLAAMAAAIADLARRAGPLVSPSELDEQAAAFEAAHPDLRPHVTLLRRCVDNYAEVLRGERTATEVMFPNASTSLVEGIYRGDRLTAHCNAEVARVVAEAAARAQGRKARILEVGAGTGGTSEAVLAALSAGGVAADYLYTDVSRAFALHGEQRFSSRYPFVRFGAYDLARDPAEQGLAPGGFDIVLGANVVHVTSDLEETGARLRSLLAPGGALVLYEMTAPPDFAIATFGLLDGWWGFADARLPHTPLLDAPGWARRLRAAGFADVRLEGIGGARPEEFRHTVIVATAPVAAARADTLVEAVRAVAAKTLEMRPEQLRPDRSFADYGADSLISVDLVAALSERFGVALKPTILFSHPTAEALAEHLAAHHGVVPPPSPSPAPRERAACEAPRAADEARSAVARAHSGPPATSWPSLSRPSTPVSRGVARREPTSIDSGCTPHIAQRLGVDGRDKPGHHGSGVARYVNPIAPNGGAARRGRASAWDDDIAIIGLSGRFPGAETIAAFEAAIIAGRDAVGPPPADRWDHAAIYDPTPGRPGKTLCPAGGFLDRIDLFDPLFFNLSPADAAAMDPQQRLFLEEAWRALEDAGYGGPHPSRRRCGVFVGCAAGDYESLLRRRGRLPDAQSFIGNSASMLAGRVAYRLDLNGPSLSVDTACSSSLVAVQLACESLMRRETDMALAGGVAVMTTPDFYIAGSGAGMLSPSGRCRTLDASADGFVPGEAVGAIVLKRRADAKRDGDSIVALIKGAAVNQDGTSNGVTAPNGKAQTALIELAQQRFALPPETLGYVELHGTGTTLGDPIEIEALKAAFGAAAAGCAIGSVKANIGHCLAAAGIAGLIKLALLLRRGVVSPALHFARANPHIGADCGGFLVPRETSPWPQRGGPRRGAVNSFGFSGTNAHLVLEAAPEPAPAATSEDWRLAVFSARSEAALQRLLASMAEWLRADGGRTSFFDICATLAQGRTHFDHRAAVPARDSAGLATALAQGETQAAPPALREARSVYLSGGAPDWDALFPPGRFRRVSLPTYSFERRRCWPQDEPAERTGAVSLLEAVLQDLGAAS
ncbi:MULTISPECIES: SDR family NAD(P)-dependent oxidoreductase [Methylosinus]|uniref:Polyketide synthase n=1 Tax=Methylosinus trichosporium (strain ATCC 35070 / NCIMB 11131 / UNIQEM 75 / OB3b) TaxID=595536 RepID=A0A2D2D6F1_METT3|nr:MULTISPECIES: SDR family NAD(P)-dependent oxidoreductase [Methylosinus]ATQ70566.1 hypothetical protein CQW49_21410 [Methylosinus trichosporium OB3b]OBS51072.1 hypothetical protein A8B73_18330 [Methylosinus sp. 3S-1]